MGPGFSHFVREKSGRVLVGLGRIGPCFSRAGAEILTYDSKNFIRLEDLKQEPELSDIFIKPNFVIDSLNTLFEAAAWNKIITLYKAKSEASTFNICDLLCYEKAIQCEKINITH